MLLLILEYSMTMYQMQVFQWRTTRKQRTMMMSFRPNLKSPMKLRRMMMRRRRRRRMSFKRPMILMLALCFCIIFSSLKKSKNKKSKGITAIKSTINEPFKYFFAIYFLLNVSVPVFSL
jgi:hypothetical protein